LDACIAREKFQGSWLHRKVLETGIVVRKGIDAMEKLTQNLREKFAQNWSESEGSLIATAKQLCMDKRNRDGTALSWEDLLSTTCLMVYSKFETFDPSRASFKTWAKGVMFYIQLNKTRKKQAKQSQIYDDDIYDQQFYEQCDDVVQLVADAELWSAFKQCTDGLTDNAKDVLLIRHLEGKSLDQTSESLGLSVAKIRTLSKKVNEYLRTCLIRKGFDLQKI
jgi:RNA polymerase sigma-70 factor (ECF subfamily)